MVTQHKDDLDKLRGEALRKAWHTCRNPPHAEADFYPLLVQADNTQTARLILVLEQRVDLVAAKAAAAGRIDAIAVPHD